MMERRTPRAMRVWRPFETLDDSERAVENEWPFPTMWWRRVPEEGVAWSPAIDIYEKEASFIVRAELPGVKMEDVDISMTGDTLTIKGERKMPEDVKEEEFECTEACYGPFTRSITLDQSVDRDKIEATMDNGILEIRLPKSPGAIPAKIEIKAKKMS